MPRKLKEFAENLRFFICLFLLCWNSDSKNSFVTCAKVDDFGFHSLKMNFCLVMSSPGGPGMLNW